MAEYVDREKILNDPMLHTYKKKDLLEKIKSMPTTCEVSVLPCKKGDTDYTGLVKELRALSKHVPEQMCDDNGIDPLEKAADAIETLLVEKDAAIGDLRGECRACEYNAGQHNVGPCTTCKYETVSKDAAIHKDDNWQWRGPRKVMK